MVWVEFCCWLVFIFWELGIQFEMNNWVSVFYTVSNHLLLQHFFNIMFPSILRKADISYTEAFLQGFMTSVFHKPFVHSNHVLQRKFRFTGLNKPLFEIIRIASDFSLSHYI